MIHTGITTIATYIATYDVPLVVLSIVIASFASYTALNLAGRVTFAQGVPRQLWLLGGAIAMGGGIWSMHFVAMLAYELPVAMAYNIPTVLISVVAAILASGLALFLVSCQKLGWLRLGLGSIFMGLGIATMHYTGMAAMRVAAIAHYDPSRVGLSVAIAILVSGVALWLAFRLRAEITLAGNLRKIGSAIIMGFAVAGMHYTGMTAVSFHPLPRNSQFEGTVQLSQAMDNSLLAFEIAIATLVILTLAVLASVFDQRITAETAKAEALRQSEERFRSLVQNSSDVIAVTATDSTICYISSSVKQILGYECEDWLGKKAFECVHPDDLAKAENQLTKALDCSATSITPSCCSIELRLRHTDNSWREFEVIANNLLAEPSVAGIVTTYRDITERKRAEEALRGSQQMLQFVMDNIPQFIFWKDRNSVYLGCNRNFAQAAGVDNPENIVGKTDYNLPWKQEEANFFRECDRRIMETDTPEYHTIEPLLQANGEQAWLDTNKVPLHDSEGKVVGILGTFEDITERKRAEEALRQAEEQYRSIFENATEGIFQTTPEGHYIKVNPALIRIYGYESAEELITNLSNIGRQLYVEPKRRAEFTRLIREHNAVAEFESQIYRKDGNVIWISENARAVYDKSGALSCYEGSIEDITKRKEAEGRLHHNAFHDGLTGLPNRALFLERLEQSVHRAKGHENYLFAVLFLDLDRFKVVNDSLGHMVGDQLLIAIARRLERSLRVGDIIARLGGDEFAILLDDIKDINSATYIAERIKQELARPFHLSGREMFTSASIGIVLGNKAAGWSDDLLRNADIAMYQAKAQGKAGYEVFDTDKRDQSYTRLQLETDLRQALERQEFRVYYQPVVSLETGIITGFEALVRWQHPTRGLIMPSEIIPVAEETGLIIPIGQWVLQEACHQMHQWQVQFPKNPPLTISVNLSVKQFTQLDLIEQVSQILQQTNLAAGSLRLEITESVLIDNAESVTAMLLQLKGLGVLLSLDDFGTGYSSLSYLHRFPISSLKIDRSFVSRMGFGDKNSKIVQAIILLAQTLEIEVIAEGIETAEQQAQLTALHCQQGQGYLFSKPLDSATAGALISLCAAGGKRTSFDVQTLLQDVQNQDSGNNL